MRPGSSDFLYLAILVICAGCRVPYNVADVRGPVRTVRVLDAETERDLPEATASFQAAHLPASGWLGSLKNGYLTPPAPGFREADRHGDADPLSRLPDNSFRLPFRLGTSYCQFVPFVAMDGPYDMVAGTIVTVSAPGYYSFKCGLLQPELGWSAIQTVQRKLSISGNWDGSADPNDVIEEACCKLDKDGALLLYLRRKGPATWDDPHYFSRKFANEPRVLAASARP